MSFQTKLKMSWGGATWDICPPDNVGTSFILEIDRTNVQTLLTNEYALDTSGCSDGQGGGGAGHYTAPSDRKIIRARIILCWTNNGNPCWLTATPPGVWTDNPNYP